MHLFTVQNLITLENSLSLVEVPDRMMLGYLIMQMVNWFQMYMVLVRVFLALMCARQKIHLCLELLILILEC